MNATSSESVASYLNIDGLLSVLPCYALSLTILLALILDHYLGEAKKYHYLVGFGGLAQRLALLVNPDRHATELASFSIYKASLGAGAWLLLVTPIPLLYFTFLNDFVWYWQLTLDAVVLYLAIGLNSLYKHAMQVYRPLKMGYLDTARYYTGYLVSRETKTLSSAAMARATTESMLENGHDSVIASIIYYLIGGAPLVIIHRFANTLDAMWGYRNPQYNSFGYASARLDDLLGFFSGKCCTFLYAIQGQFMLSIKNAYRQGNRYKSHNGGWVMAAGASVMQRTLGGSASYHGTEVHSVTLGKGKAVTLDDIPNSVTLVRRAAVLLLGLSFAWQTLNILFVHGLV